MPCWRLISKPIDLWQSPSHRGLFGHTHRQIRLFLCFCSCIFDKYAKRSIHVVYALQGLHELYMNVACLSLAGNTVRKTLHAAHAKQPQRSRKVGKLRYRKTVVVLSALFKSIVSGIIFFLAWNPVSYFWTVLYFSQLQVCGSFVETRGMDNHTLHSPWIALW